MSLERKIVLRIRGSSAKNFASFGRKFCEAIALDKFMR